MFDISQPQSAPAISKATKRIARAPRFPTKPL
jgi:hypothetical protein